MVSIITQSVYISPEDYLDHVPLRYESYSSESSSSSTSSTPPKFTVCVYVKDQIPPPRGNFLGFLRSLFP